MFFRAIYLNKTTVLIGQNEGLPNIIGSLGSPTTEGSIWGSGALKSSGNDGWDNRSAGGGGNSYRINFNAANGEIKTDGNLKSSNDYKVYGKSNHVTPCNATLKVWQRIS